MKLYSSIKSESASEQIIDRSRFICHISPVNSKEEADEYIRSIRERYKDATHNVPCFVLGSKMEIKWQSDDSEPQGTAGLPALDVLVKEGLTNIVCVVTRYFGGIKLGTGGLVRAYQSSVKLALNNAIICDATEMTIIKFNIDYATNQRLENMKEKCYNVLSRNFSDKVTLEVSTLREKADDAISMIQNVSCGKGKVLDRVDTILMVEK